MEQIWCNFTKSKTKGGCHQMSERKTGMIVWIIAISIAIILRAIGRLMIDLAIAKRIKKNPYKRKS